MTIKRQKQLSEEHKANISKALKGRKISAESIRKQSESLKESYRTGKVIVWNKGLKGYKGGLTFYPKGHVPWNKGLTKNSDPLMAEASQRMKEAHLKNRQLNGDNSGVSGKHDRLRRKYGCKRVCDNCGTLDARYYDWANLDHKYNSEDEEMWARLCRKCHTRYDLGRITINGKTITERGGTIKNTIDYLVKAKYGDDNIAKRQDVRDKISKSSKGRHPTEESRLKMRLSHLGKTRSAESKRKASISIKRHFALKKGLIVE